MVKDYCNFVKDLSQNSFIFMDHKTSAGGIYFYLRINITVFIKCLNNNDNLVTSKIKKGTLGVDILSESIKK